MPASVTNVSHHRDALIDRAAAADSACGVFAEASPRLRRLIPFDSAIWLATDPAAAMPTAPTRKENLTGFDVNDCVTVWEREFLVEDVNAYQELAHREIPAAGLRVSTGDRPARSGRYRKFLRPHGLGDEMRFVCRIDGAPWAWVSLFREAGRPAFTERDAEFLGGLSEPLAAALREHARPGVGAPMPREAHGPGLMLFAPDGSLLSINDEARAWLDEFPPIWDDGDLITGKVDNRFGIDLPILVVGALMRARAIAEERDFGPARARMRSPSTGRWLVCHASCMRNDDGSVGNTALVIEPAKASEIAPIIAQAYELSRREQEITQLIAQGLGTAAIAERLFLSVHTVRDYVKTIFDKVGVSSRGELVAKLFAEHYAPTHVDPANVESTLFTPSY